VTISSTFAMASGIVVVVMIAVLVYAIVIRPWHLRWGATDEEVQGTLPGDLLLPSATAQVTHAVSIHASAADVWPWLVQMGQDRGGFYSYTWLENLVGCKMKNANRLVPQWQHLQEGDPVRLHPAYAMHAHVIEQNRALVLGNSPPSQSRPAESKRRTDWAPKRLGLPLAATEGNDLNFTWAFVVEEKSDRHSRLIVRVRAQPKSGLASSLWNLLYVEPTHFAMERKMLLGIKKRVEQGQ
jgi:hypothetical protein